MSLLSDWIISKVRVKLLEILLFNPGQIIHVRELVRKTGEEINAVRRELAHLEKIGAVGKERRANRLYYLFKKDYPLYFDLLEMVAKTSGLGGAIIKNKNKLGKIKFAMLSGQYARNIPGSSENVDLLVVGDIVVPEIAALVRDEETRKHREIYFTPMTEEEFVYRKKKKDPFIGSVLAKSRLMVVGDEEELVR